MQPALDLVDAGRFAEALPILKAAADTDPRDPEIHRLAGECLTGLGEYEAATGAFQRAISIRPDWPAPCLGAAGALARRGDAFASMQTLLHVLGFAPGHLEATQQLAGLLARLKPDRYLSALEPALLQCFAHPDIDPTPLTALCAQQLRLGFAERFGADDFADDTLDYLEGSDLWRRYLSRVINTDPQLEAFLTRLRWHLCLHLSADSAAEAPVNLIAALAQQCFLNEYVFDCSDVESERLAKLGRRDGGKREEEAALCFALGCLYCAPMPDAATKQLAESLSEDFPWISALCRVTVFEPWEEARLGREIPTLEKVSDETSLAVQAQYEANPYPRWHTPPAPSKVPLAEAFRRQFSLRREVQHETSRARLLVAGCGTGFEPVDIARRDSSIDITAIDLSRRSLAYAKRKAQLLECTNIDFYQGDILDLPRTDWEFDLVVCSGVLHHMEDPLAGWEALCSLLAPHGMMRIGLYSAHARRDVSRFRDLIRAHGWTGDIDNIRGFRGELLEAGEGGEFSNLLHSEDFYSMSGCRDLLFHVQEKQFTLPEIQSALDQLGLVFGGFDIADPAVLAAFTAQNPAPDALRDLEAWDRFERENPHAFSGMYQFWCERAAA